MKIAAGLAVVGFGPGGAIIGAFIAILPHAISLGDRLGDISFELTEIGKKANKLRGASGQKRGRTALPSQLSPGLRRELQQARADRFGASKDLEAAEKAARLKRVTSEEVKERNAARGRLKEANKRLQAVEQRANKAERTTQARAKKQEKEAAKPTDKGGGRARVPGTGAAPLSAFGAEQESEINRQVAEAERFAGVVATGSGLGGKAAEKVAKARGAEVRRTLRAQAERGELMFQEPDTATLAELIDRAKTGLPFDLTREAERMRAPVTITVQNFNFDQDIEINIDGEGLDPQSIADRVIEDQQEAMSQAAQNFLPVVAR